MTVDNIPGEMTIGDVRICSSGPSNALRFFNEGRPEGGSIIVYRSQLGNFFDGLLDGRFARKQDDEVWTDPGHFGVGKLRMSQERFDAFVAAIRAGDLDSFREPPAAAEKRDKLRQDRALSA